MSPQPWIPRRRVPWHLLVWTLPMAYVFWDPLQLRAGWVEWIATVSILATVLALFLAALTYADHSRFVAFVCAALLLIAAGFLFYRPSGGIYFPVVAAVAPAAVRGRIAGSMAIAMAVASVFGAEWLALYAEPARGVFFPLFVVSQVFVSGIGATFAYRQERELQRRDKATERERIAKDLHDVLGHSLSSLALKAELARRLFHADPERALQEIGDVERIARQGLEDMRGAIHGYYAGDVHAELDRAEQLLTAANIRVERRCEQLEMLPAKERVLALIVREAVTNILRHSRAEACRFALCRADGTYRLEISDDGCGGGHREGVGMRSIRTRAEALGGTAVWSSAAGTHLAVSLPLDAVERG